MVRRRSFVIETIMLSGVGANCKALDRVRGPRMPPCTDAAVAHASPRRRCGGRRGEVTPRMSITTAIGGHRR